MIPVFFIICLDKSCYFYFQQNLFYFYCLNIFNKFKEVFLFILVNSCVSCHLTNLGVSGFLLYVMSFKCIFIFIRDVFLTVFSLLISYIDFMFVKLFSTLISHTHVFMSSFRISWIYLYVKILNSFVI